MNRTANAEDIKKPSPPPKVTSNKVDKVPPLALESENFIQAREAELRSNDSQKRIAPVNALARPPHVNSRNDYDDKGDRTMAEEGGEPTALDLDRVVHDLNLSDGKSGLNDVSELNNPTS